MLRERSEAKQKSPPYISLLKTTPPWPPPGPAPPSRTRILNTTHRQGWEGPRPARPRPQRPTQERSQHQNRTFCITRANRSSSAAAMLSRSRRTAKGTFRTPRSRHRCSNRFPRQPAPRSPTTHQVPSRHRSTANTTPSRRMTRVNTQPLRRHSWIPGPKHRPATTTSWSQDLHSHS